MSYNTITLEQLINNASGFGDQYGFSYTPENNPVSYEASLMTAVDRGTRIESVVHKFIEDMGYTAHQTLPDHAWDITLDLPNGPVRVEVKSALMGHNNGKRNFKMQNIKPHNFDYIVFAFVHPTDGIILKWCDRKEFMSWAYDRKEGKTGYALNFNARDGIKHKYISLQDMDDFPGDME